MSAKPEDKLYPSVLRMVVWDESRETVFKMLEVNGIVGEPARELYQTARSERISTIRTDCYRKCVVGILWFLAGIALFLIFWFAFGAGTHGIFIFSGVAVVNGLWKTVDGFMGMLLAPRKRGSIAE